MVTGKRFALGVLAIIAATATGMWLIRTVAAESNDVNTSAAQKNVLVENVSPAEEPAPTAPPREENVNAEQLRTNINPGCRFGYVDADGDGICDHRASGGYRRRHRQGQSRGPGFCQGHGRGSGRREYAKAESSDSPNGPQQSPRHGQGACRRRGCGQGNR